MGGGTTWLKRLFSLSRSLTLELRLPLMFQEEQTSPIWDTWIWLMREQLTWGWRHTPAPSSLSPPGSFYVSGLLSHYPSLTLLVPPGEEPAPHQTLQEMQRLSSPFFVSLSSLFTHFWTLPLPLPWWSEKEISGPGLCLREGRFVEATWKLSRFWIFFFFF